jgi:hypothetical protein
MGNQNCTMRSTESTVGPLVVRLYHCQLCQTYDCIRSRWGDILLRFVLRHLLAQETQSDASLCFSNELISRGKGLHCNLACLMYLKLANRFPESWIVEIVSSAVAIEIKFAVDALPDQLIGMNSTMMCNYIKFYTDRLLITLGYQRHYKVGNTFEWMETIRL